MAEKVVTLEKFQSRLEAARSKSAESGPESSEVGDLRWRYRAAAAVASTFDVPEMKPLEAEREKSVEDVFLRLDCRRVIGEDGLRHWQLRSPVRRATFHWLANNNLMAVAAGMIDGSDLVTGLLGRYMASDSPALEAQSVDELYGTLQVLDWLDGAVSDVPTQTEVRARLNLQEVLQPLLNLVGEHFVGRKPVLDELYDYVEVLPPSSRRSGIRRSLRSILSLTEEPPLLLHGPGGVGKSTVIAKFIVDHANLDEDDRFPYVYLNFDRPDLVADEPLTLLIECVRQISAQYPDSSDLAEALRTDWITELTSAVRYVSRSGETRKSRRPTIDVQPQVKRFADFTETCRNDGPVLLVVDTFEEVQRRGQLAVDRLWAFLDDLQHELSKLRVVLAGRAQLREHRTREIHIGDFDDEIAEAYLGALLTDLEPDPTFVKRAVQRVGNNPLSLKLAADVVRNEGADALRDVRTRNLLVFKVREAEIQGQLYRRILDHLEDPNLRKIANPGLVLRRVTADLIEYVLADACDLKISSAEEAAALFELLKREASLVSETEGGAAVYHRPDVRRAMLGYLEDDDPKKVRQIHRAAVAYYKARDGVPARAEELYHRLALGQRPVTIDKYWHDGALPLLEGSLDELPAEGRAYLASRLGHDVGSETLEEISDENWRRQAARQGESLLADGRAADALSLLSSRLDDGGESLLPAIAARALLLTGDLEGAYEVAERGMARAAEQGDVLDFIDLSMTASAAAEVMGRYEDAVVLLREGKRAADEDREPIAILRVGVSQLRMFRRVDQDSSEEARQVRRDLLSLVESVPERELTSEPQLLRDLAAELGSGSPTVLKQALRVIGIDTVDEADNQALAGALEDWDAKVSKPRGTKRVILDTAQNVSKSGESGGWAEWLGDQTSIDKGRSLWRLLEDYEDTPSEVPEHLSGLYRAQSDADHAGGWLIES